jgi:hypothetical protein
MAENNLQVKIIIMVKIGSGLMMWGKIARLEVSKLKVLIIR